MAADEPKTKAVADILLKWRAAHGEKVCRPTLFCDVVDNLKE